jgi:hypothetical protein
MFAFMRKRPHTGKYEIPAQKKHEDCRLTRLYARRAHHRHTEDDKPCQRF